MRKKKNTKFRALDLVIIVLCLAGSCASGTAFWREYNRTLIKLHEASVGVIIIKNRVADRKFMNRLAWDRLRREAPVYNGDTIRTADLSRAVIFFRDNVTSIDLSESTLIQIFYDDKEGVRVDLSGGAIEVSGSRSVRVSSGSSSVEVQGNAALNKNAGGLNVAVREGQARLNGTDLAAGDIRTALDSGAVDTRPAVTVTSFGNTARMTGDPAAPTAVNFSWNTAHFQADTHVMVEVAADRNFSRVVAVRDAGDERTLSIPLENGTWFWRVYPARGGSGEPANPVYPSGTMELIPAAAVSGLAPVRGTELVLSDSAPVPLSWSAVEGARAYHVEISPRPDMSGPVVSRQVEGTAVAETGLETGRWYWRVTPVFPDRYFAGAVSGASAVSEFTVVRGASLAEPVPTYPPHNGSLNIKTQDHSLVWRNDSAADFWTVEVADNPDFSGPLVHQRVNANYYALPAGRLELGKSYHWRITASGAGGATALSRVHSFTALDSSPAPVRLAAAPPVPPPPVEAPPLAAPVEPVRPAAASRPVETRPVETRPVPEAPPAPVSVPPKTETVIPPEPEPVIAAAVPEPAAGSAPGADSPLTAEETYRRLTRVSGGGSITDTFPRDGHVLSTGQLAGAPSINFAWEGKTGEYRFALYRADGTAVIAPSTVTAPAYTLANPALLTGGDYVWQVYEKDRQGNWTEAPSAARRFSVVEGEAPVKTLPTKDPGALYGKP